MEYRILGTVMPLLQIILKRDGIIKCQVGAMMGGFLAGKELICKFCPQAQNRILFI